MEPTLAPVLGAVLSVFGLVGCGYAAGRLRLVTQASSHALNQFVYAFALPAMLFIAGYREDCRGVRRPAPRCDGFRAGPALSALEAEASTGAVISTVASLLTVSLVMALLTGR